MSEISTNAPENKILSSLKFWIVDPFIHIFDDLSKQTPLMWIFIGWGWLSILVMITSVPGQLLQLVSG